jgi:protein-S-isoprenylcysteine O-methyltransferase Ste14
MPACRSTEDRPNLPEPRRNKVLCCIRAAHAYMRDMTDTKDNAGIIAPPPLIALAAVVLGFVLDWLVPLFVLDTLFGFLTRVVVGLATLAAGIALPVLARRRFVEAGTNVNPYRPVMRLVTSGVYRHVRNPMYVGLMLMAGGIGIAFASDWTLLMIIPLALILRTGVVLREERYLEQKFGDEYRRYKSSVPRWGIW